jgi:hypothetical protein
MEPGGSLPRSQEPANCPYPERGVNLVSYFHGGEAAGAWSW